jgi:hypothetical protein
LLVLLPVTLNLLRAQGTDEPIPDLQCVYAEAELTSVFMDRSPNRYLDEQLVELLHESCGAPTPKSELIYLYIRSAVAMRRYDGTNPAALAESMDYYRMIISQQHHLADIAQLDPDFVLEYRYQLAELARLVEANYIDTFAANAPEMNTRGQAATYGISRGSQVVVPATTIQLTPGYYSTAATDWGQSRGGAPASSAAFANATQARVQQPIAVTRSLSPVEAEAMRTRQALRSAQSRYAGYRHVANTYSRGNP